MIEYAGLLFDAKNDLEWTVVGVSKDVDNMNAANIPASFWGKAVTEIGKYAFANNQSIEAVRIPKFVNTVGCSAFDNCKNLKYVFFEYGNDVLSIGERAFHQCSMLTDITCLKKAIIFREAFAECKNLRIVDGCFTEIQEQAFRNCQMLHTINLQSQVMISIDAFKECNRLARINVVKEIRDGFSFLKHLPTCTTIHCSPESNLVRFVYEGYKIVASL